MTTSESDLRNIPGEMADVFADAELAMQAIIRDPGVWEEELARDMTGKPLLPWPLSDDLQGLPGILRWLAVGAVEGIVLGYGLQMPDDPTEPHFQIILRVCKRAVDAAHRSINPYWNRPGRLSGWRDLLNWLKQRRMDEMARSGAKGKQAAELAGLSVASSYRAQHRKARKSGKK